MDTVMTLLACLPDSVRSEKLFSQLTADSRVRLADAALSRTLLTNFS
jgi:hypothetical protein